MKDIRNYDLTSHNTFGIKAHCRRFVEFASVTELQCVLSQLTTNDRPLLIVGSGSNLLLTSDFEGTVLHSAILGMEISDDLDQVFVRVGSGESWDDFVGKCVEKGWHGVENLSLIPGEVGASAIQNIGAYGVEAKDVIYEVEAVRVEDCKTVKFKNVDCGYAYRQSRFKDEWAGKYIITYVTYCLSKVFKPHLDYGNIRAELQKRNIETPTAKQLREIIIDIRKAKLPDPAVTGNAGSFFKNPIVDKSKYLELAELYPLMPHYTIDEYNEKIPAGWLIEQCGWKGKTLGRVGVHAKQALVLVNLGGATGMDVLNLCNTIMDDVKNKFGIKLVPEVNIR